MRLPFRSPRAKPTVPDPAPSHAPAGLTSYAQSGEDMIARFVLNTLGVTRPNYLDLGAYDAVRLSNTFHFYEAGSQGVCVEADPALATAFAKARPRDQVINAAISGRTSGKGRFFIMAEQTLNTLSQAEAERLEREEQCQISATIEIDILPVAKLIAQSFPDQTLDFLSIDLEGIDEEIIGAIDFNFARPKVICIETLSYSRIGGQTKKPKAAEILLGQDYMTYADTYINTIFVDAALWRART